MAPLITNIITTFNKSFLTSRCLNNLCEHTENPVNVIVVDNCSSDDTERVVESYRAPLEGRGHSLKFHRNPRPLGFGKAMNVGVRMSDTPYVVIQSNDTWASRSWDVKCVETIRGLDAKLICPSILEGDHKEEDIKVRAARFVARHAGKYRVAFEPSFMFFDRQAFVDLGMFDERFFLTREDTDLLHRMKLAGTRYFQVGDVFVWHFCEATRKTKEGLPSDYEEQANNAFIGKWGFNPRVGERRFLARQARTWRKFRAKQGWF